MHVCVCDGSVQQLVIVSVSHTIDTKHTQTHTLRVQWGTTDPVLYIDQ